MPPSVEAIHLGAEREGRPAAEGIRFGFVLVVFMRVVAVLWLVKGLLQWKAILVPDVTPFDTLATPLAVSMGFFAVADLLAAVGLWLASAWGGVLWLFTASVGMIVTLAMRNFERDSSLVAAVKVGGPLILIVIYFVLTWYAARERDI
jgi:hypothetical protein